MSVDRNRIKQIEARWKDERKIGGADVDWLISLAYLAQAAEVRDLVGRVFDPLSDLFGRKP